MQMHMGVFAVASRRMSGSPVSFYTLDGMVQGVYLRKIPLFCRVKNAQLLEEVAQMNST